MVAKAPAAVHTTGRRRGAAGPGALFFAAVVVVTMFAAEAFDPRLIWDGMEEIDDGTH